MKAQDNNEASAEPAELNLLVPWEPAWSAFATSVVATLRPSGRRSPLSVASGIPLRAPLLSLLLHCVVLLVWKFAGPWVAIITPATLELTPPDLNHVAITLYYFHENLPELSDVAGAERGRKSAPASGEWFHPTQVIRIVRGSNTTPVVVDAPHLRLPRVQLPPNLLEFSRQMPIAPPPAVTHSLTLRPLASLPTTVPLPPPAPMFIKQPEPRSPDKIQAPENLKLTVTKPHLPALRTTMPALPAKVARTAEPPVSSVPADSGAGQVAEVLLPSASSDLAGGSGASTANLSGLMISVNPGYQVGIREDANGALALAPSGAAGGVGGKGNGDRAGTGGRTAAIGSGSGDLGNGLGAGPNDHAGIAPAGGPGGAGIGSALAAPSQGGVLVVNGGYYVPSFSGSPGNSAVRKGASSPPSKLPAVVVVATPQSSITLDPASPLRGRRIYTIYLDTRIGTVVMQFADTAPPGARFEDLTAPTPIVADLAADLRPSGTIINCILDATGKLRDLHVVKTSSPELMPKLSESLRKWLFRPALRGEDAIEVVTTLGIQGKIN